MTTIPLATGGNLVLQPGAVYAPGHVKWAEPVGMRPADLRMAGDRIGEYHLANGKVVWLTWVPTGQTHTDIVVWDAGTFIQTEKDIVRTNAARVSERMLAVLEA